MGSLDRRVAETARRQHGLVTRADVLAAGGNDDAVLRRLRDAAWQRLQDGVYLVGPVPPTWLQSLHAACLAGAPGAVASYRGAGLLWELDGVRGSVVEVTVPFSTRSVVDGAIVHRSRRLDADHVTVHRGVPVTVVERTLVDLGRYVPAGGVEAALECALRRGLTNESDVVGYLTGPGGRRRPGAGVLRRVLGVRAPGRSAGSAAEVAFLRALRARGVPDPVRQHPVRLRDGSVAVVDFAWPEARLAVEWDGFEVHGGRRAFGRDLERQNALFDAGWQLRRYTGDAVRRRADRIAATILRIVCTPTAA